MTLRDYLVLFREPDGRMDKHADDEIKKHRENWNNWFSTWGKKGNLAGGSALTLNGCVIKGGGDHVINDIYKNGTEIVGGYVLLKARDLNEAVEIMRGCPVYEFGGYAEIRELQSRG